MEIKASIIIDDNMIRKVLERRVRNMLNKITRRELDANREKIIQEIQSLRQRAEK